MRRYSLYTTQFPTNRMEIWELHTILRGRSYTEALVANTMTVRLRKPSNLSCSPYGLHLQKYKKISITSRFFHFFLGTS